MGGLRYALCGLSYPWAAGTAVSGISQTVPSGDIVHRSAGCATSPLLFGCEGWRLFAASLTVFFQICDARGVYLQIYTLEAFAAAVPGGRGVCCRDAGIDCISRDSIFLLAREMSTPSTLLNVSPLRRGCTFFHFLFLFYRLPKPILHAFQTYMTCLLTLFYMLSRPI